MPLIVIINVKSYKFIKITVFYEIVLKMSSPSDVNYVVQAFLKMLKVLKTIILVNRVAHKVLLKKGFGT